MKIMRRVNERISRMDAIAQDILAMAQFSGNTVTYTTQNGECDGIGIFNNKSVAVQHAVMTPGTVLKCHAHSETEILVLYDGDLSIDLGAYIHHAVVGRPVSIEPNTPHIAATTDGCKMIAITIPASPGYPPAKQN